MGLATPDPCPGPIVPHGTGCEPGGIKFHKVRRCRPKRAQRPPSVAPSSKGVAVEVVDASKRPPVVAEVVDAKEFMVSELTGKVDELGQHGKLQPPVPRWQAFKRCKAVNKFVSYLVSQRMFSLTDIKRGMHQFLMETDGVDPGTLGILKPNGLHVSEMFTPAMFRSGHQELPSRSHSLQVSGMDPLHIRSCKVCSVQGVIAEECYFHAMRRCVTHGWAPPIDAPAIHPVYEVRGNYDSVQLYGGSVAKEFGI